MDKFVFDFSHAHDRPPMELKDLLGGKGANLAEMTSVLDLPVPPGFTISTEACRAYMEGGWPANLSEEVSAALSRLESQMGKSLGAPANPLLVSVRSGAKASMPGMMDTVLNLGLNDQSVEGLASQTGDEQFAWDSYRRFIAMYSRIVLDLPAEPFDRLAEAARELSGAKRDADIPLELLRYLVKAYLEIVQEATKSQFPQDPKDQLHFAIEAVFRSWNRPRAIAYRNREAIAHDLGTAVNIVAMVFGNRDDRSGTGVGFTRDPNTGEQGAYGDFLLRAQGEDVVAGTADTEPLSALSDQFPEIYRELLDIFERLEHHYRDMCDTEFTIEQGKLWMLQTRVGKRTGRAAMRMAVEMVDDPQIGLSHAEAVQRVTAEHIDSVLHPQFAPGQHTLLAKGLGASPGAAVGKVCFTPEAAVREAEAGGKAILVRSETSPEDVHGLLASQGVLTSRGGLVSHAAVVARGWGKPAVVGAGDLRISHTEMTIGSQVVREGEVISIDGTSGEVVLGEVELTRSEAPQELEVLLQWADEIRKGKMGVRANADNGQDAQNARRFGAEGIGLCRTEHMFLAEHRLAVVRRMILSEGSEEESEALEALGEAQKEDFLTILEAMDGLPVVVRLLDPPLHEFLPDVAELSIKEAKGELDGEETELLAAARRWREVNPMLGTRGVRLGVIKPGLYQMQVRALVQAAVLRAQTGGHPIVEVMIPLTVSREELALAKGWVEEAISTVKANLGEGESDLAMDITIGTMIETPRAALRAAELAEIADFFSFGTNDLTQMTFAFSRDDIEAKLMPIYLDKHLLKSNPFQTLDVDAVGELVRIGTERGRSTRSDLKIGVCGEHGGDPVSIHAFARMGVNYVSCSPYRVPVARLSAAHAVLDIENERASLPSTAA